jgi:fatty acid desaturase
MMPTANPPTLHDPDFLRRINALRHTDNFRNWFYLAREYAWLLTVIGTTIALYHLLPAAGVSLAWAVPVTLLSILLIGAGQHRLGTLTHEAAHYILFRNRLLGELASEWFCMFPMLGTTHSYRVQHLGHHQYPNDPVRDPDWTQLHLSGHRFYFPMRRVAFLWHALVKQLLLPHYLLRYSLVRAFFIVDQGDGSPYRMKRRQSRVLKIVALAYHVGVIALLAAAVVSDDAHWLAPLPLMLGAVVGVYGLAPERWFAEYAIRPDIPVRWSMCLRALFNTLLWSTITVMTVCTGMPWWLYYLMLWLVPLGTSFALCMILRQLVQHGNADRERYTNTRVFMVHPLVRFAVFPLGQDYHLPHHLFPLVPHYNLRKLHELLLVTDRYRKTAVVVKGYILSPERPPEHPTVLDLMAR